MLVADVVLLLAVGAVALLAGRALGLPAIVAYLVAGVLVGPGGAGLVPRSDAVSELAELGVALLLFGVGIEFSLDRLRRILPRMVASGALQMAGTIGATALGFGWLGLPWPAALLTGFLVSLSSTAIVFKVYDERGELDAPHGLAASGILLFQDLAMVPMVLLVPVLATAGDGAAAAAVWALAEGVAALVAVLVLARAVLPRAHGRYPSRSASTTGRRAIQRAGSTPAGMLTRNAATAAAGRLAMLTCRSTSHPSWYAKVIRTQRTASAAPMTRPPARPRNPTPAASPTTERAIWPRVAPAARSSANSRRRSSETAMSASARPSPATISGSTSSARVKRKARPTASW